MLVSHRITSQFRCGRATSKHSAPRRAVRDRPCCLPLEIYRRRGSASVRGTERAQQGAHRGRSWYGSRSSFTRWDEGGAGRNRRSKVKDCDRGALGACASLQLGGGFLHLLAHGVQIVGGGNNRKQ